MKKLGADADREIASISGWVVLCLLLWIIAFPWYLVTRSSILRQQAPRTVALRGASYSAPDDRARQVVLAAPAFGVVTQPGAGFVDDSDVDRVRQTASEILKQATLAKGLSAVAEPIANKVPDEQGRLLFAEGFVAGASLAHADRALGWSSPGAVDEATIAALAETRDDYIAGMTEAEHVDLISFALECGFYFGVNDQSDTSTVVLSQIAEITDKVFGLAS